MIFPSPSLTAYLDEMQFPINVLEHDGPRVSLICERDDIERLIALNIIVGVGRRNKLRWLRLAWPVEKMAVIKFKMTGRIPSAEDSKTTYRQKNGGKETWSHHAGRSGAYSNGGAPINKDYV